MKCETAPDDAFYFTIRNGTRKHPKCVQKHPTQKRKSEILQWPSQSGIHEAAVQQQLASHPPALTPHLASTLLHVSRMSAL